ncbi:hypothetical protein LLEC1_04026 [Akanthomyces lecanii]|uniref:Uncharacterized protein n=1 Tax=Cordyceps confragosa TaxID=2714763 RepID=A0A179IB91_CORDF|nr:hypothetical protein LLEC1_04026 [Akanthomyces lecanii]
MRSLGAPTYPTKVQLDRLDRAPNPALYITKVQASVPHSSKPSLKPGRPSTLLLLAFVGLRELVHSHMDDDTAEAMAAAMGFSSFGAQNPQSKKRKYNPNNDAVVSIDGDERRGTSANSAPVERRRAPPANADEIALDDEVDGANDTSDTAALGAAASGHHGTNRLWYVDYYDHFSNENPWAKLEEAAGLQPISTWIPVHVNRDEAHQAPAA